MIYTKLQVMKKLEAYCLKHKNYAAASRKLGVSEATLSNMRADRIPLSDKVCEQIGLHKVKVYVDKIENKYLDGSQLL